MNSQPIPKPVTGPPSAVTGGEATQSKPRVPRSEKRAKPRTERTTRSTGKQGKPTHVIADEIINSVHPDKLDSVIVLLLQAKERRTLKGKAKDIRRGNQATLESRITQDVHKERKELSPAKLAKIEKRREMRAEKKKIWLEKKAAQGAVEAQAGPSGETSATSVPAAGAASAVSSAHSGHDDEINFDDL